MDAIYRTQRHFYDLTRKYYLLGRDRLIRELAPPKGGTVLAWLPHVVGWKGVREIDLIPGGDPHPLEFSAEVRDEWLADRPDLLGPLVQAMGEAYQAHADALGAAAKN